MHYPMPVYVEPVQVGAPPLIPEPHPTVRHLMLAMVSFLPPYMNPCHGKASCRHDLERRANAMLDFVFQGVRRRNV